MAENANANDEFETDENGQVVTNKDGSPRRRRGRKPAEPTPEPPTEPDAAVEDKAEDEPTEDDAPADTIIVTSHQGVVRTIPGDSSLELEFLAHVQVELDKVFAKYGEQNRPHLFNLLDQPSYARREREYKARYVAQELMSQASWDTVVGEEFFEAFAEEDPEKQYDELVQLAAMATLAATSLKRASE